MIIMVKDEISEKIEKALNYGLEYAKKAGAEFSEAFGLNQRAFNFQIEKNLPKHNIGILHGMSFRVIANNALGFAYTSSFNKEDIKHTVDSAIQNAKTKKPDPDLKEFPTSTKSLADLPVDEKLFNISNEEVAAVFEDLILEDLPKNLFFLQAMGTLGTGDGFLKNSQGIDIHDRDAGYGGGVGFLSVHGFPNYDFHFEGSRKWGNINGVSIRNIAIDKTLQLAKPRTLSLAGKYPIIIPPDGSYGLMGGLFTILNILLRGDKAFRGETPYSDRIGELIAPDNFSLIDDPHHPDMIPSASYDGEGIPTQKTALIDKGVLQTYYLDAYYAGKLNMESNGKATRGGGMFGGNPVKSPPSIGSYSTVIEPGDSSLDEMLTETREGFMLKNFMGIHMSDFSSGRFSVTGGGWYIKNGEIQFPVQDITISGTIPQLLKDIDLISKERKKGLNNEVPYLKVSSLDVTAKKMDFKIRFGMKILKLLVNLGLVKNPFA